VTIIVREPRKGMFMERVMLIAFAIFVAAAAGSGQPIVQVHGVGPFHIHWRAGNAWRDTLKTLDDPDAGTIFKFTKGDRVVAGRRAGRIRQGYDSGEMIGYEIEAADGTLFAAEEKDLRRAGKPH